MITGSRTRKLLILSFITAVLIVLQVVLIPHGG